MRMRMIHPHPHYQLLKKHIIAREFHSLMDDRMQDFCELFVQL